MATQAQAICSSGQLFESQIKATLERAGYTHVDKSKTLDTPYFYHQYTTNYKSMYGKRMRSDFYCVHPTKYPDGLLIEVKYQGTTGSTDEKFPYLVMSLKALDVPSILVLEGGGATRSAIDWCLAQNCSKFKAFNGMTPFIRALNKGLI
jgi:hypothetical protein